jgi:hypothetical protein
MRFVAHARRSEAPPAHRGSRGGPGPDLDKLAARLVAEVHVGIAHRGLRSNQSDLARHQAENGGAISVDARHRATDLGKDLMGGTSRIGARPASSLWRRLAGRTDDKGRRDRRQRRHLGPRRDLCPRRHRRRQRRSNRRSITELALNSGQRRAMTLIGPSPHAARLRWVLGGRQLAVVAKLVASLPLG